MENSLSKYLVRSFMLVFMVIFSSLNLSYGASSLKVMTYNVNLLPNIPITPLTQNLNHPYERARLIPYQIEKYKPDIVVFQEDIAPIMYFILNKNMKQVGYKYRTEVVGSWDLDHINLLSGGVIIYSRYPFAEPPQYLILPKSYGWEAISNKGAVFAAVKKKNKVYNIISVHMQSIQYASEDKDAQIVSWKVQIGALNQWIANLNLSADEPLILAGDLNADSGFSKSGEITLPSIDYPLYQYMLMALNAKQAAVYAENTLPYSFDGVTDSMNNSTVRETLDHILCFSGYVCPTEANSSTKIIALKSAMLEAPDLSDHYAVISQLTYQ
ncbi:endonuclease/exonuclease/phosphatase family protein [Thiotrichales bacterium 19S3-7]|nr:endonuclease/exonuclease/phosphatase family protein [Thiotrichales bacterium 19S3-7]MCF6802478.1 endonuclease/exonuclease/phosphatase family protein [Thiotrichales bacterium 19S3-11]